MSSVLVENAASDAPGSQADCKLEEGEVRIVVGTTAAVAASAGEATPPLPRPIDAAAAAEDDEETKKRTRPEQSPPPDHDADIFDKEESSPNKKQATSDNGAGVEQAEVVVNL